MKAFTVAIRGFLLVSAVALMSGCADRELMREAIEAARLRADQKEQDLAALVMEYPGYRDLLVALLFDKDTGPYNSTQCVIEEEAIKRIAGGRFGGAAQFKQNSIIRIPVLSIPEAGTLAFWFRVARGTDLSSEIRLVDCNGICMMIHQGQLRSVFHDTETMRKIAHGEPTRAGRWLHVALTWGNRKQVLYVNGEMAGIVAYSGKPKYTSRDMIWGARWTGTGHKFIGDMDEICLYGRQLNPNEVASLYHKGLDYKAGEE